MNIEKLAKLLNEVREIRELTKDMLNRINNIELGLITSINENEIPTQEVRQTIQVQVNIPESKEELKAANDAIVERQKGKIVIPTDRVPMPSLEEREKLAKEQNERAMESMGRLLSILGVDENKDLNVLVKEK